MNELERQRVTRIALDHAIRLQQEEPPPRPHVCLRLAVVSAAGAAVLATTVAQFLH